MIKITKLVSKNLPKKGMAKAHLYSGAKINLTNAMRTSMGIFSFTFNITAILTDSPSSSLNTFAKPGTGQQNRAYIDIETNQIFEWNYISDCKNREVRIYENYELIKGQWRGAGLIMTQYFDPNGFPISKSIAEGN